MLDQCWFCDMSLFNCFNSGVFWFAMTYDHLHMHTLFQGNIANVISTIQANKITEDGSQAAQGLVVR